MRTSITILLVAMAIGISFANETEVETSPEHVLDGNLPGDIGVTTLAAKDSGFYNTTSILLSAKVSILVTYMDTSNKTQTATVVVPVNGTVTGDDHVYNDTAGHYDYTEQWIQLQAIDGQDGWFVKLTFTNSTEHGASRSGEFALAAVEVRYNSETAPSGTFVNNTATILGDVVNETPSASWTMRAPVSKSYVCEHGDSLVKVDDVITVRFDDLQVQPFSTEGASFVQGASCLADKSASDLVPIVVGACLALLVIVVLVAYLVGRARTKRQGYASV